VTLPTTSPAGSAAVVVVSAAKASKETPAATAAVPATAVLSRVRRDSFMAAATFLGPGGTARG
jgi:hypothetical protein